MLAIESLYLIPLIWLYLYPANIDLAAFEAEAITHIRNTGRGQLPGGPIWLTSCFLPEFLVLALLLCLSSAAATHKKEGNSAIEAAVIRRVRQLVD
jgi:hypothetical protein